MVSKSSGLAVVEDLPAQKPSSRGPDQKLKIMLIGCNNFI